MIRSFDPVCTIQLTHDFFAGAVDGIEFVIPGTTARRMREVRLLARPETGRLKLYADRPAAQEVIPSWAGASLVIGLRFTDPRLANVTASEVPGTFPNVGVPHYANARSPRILDAPVARRMLAPTLFTHTPAQAPRPLTSRLWDSEGRVIASTTLWKDDRVATFDLRSAPEGAYLIEDDDLSPTRSMTPLQVHGELFAADIVAVVAIRLDAAFAMDPPLFTVPFASLVEQLRYVVVAKNFSDAEILQFDVTDAGFTDEKRDKITFTRIVVPTTPTQPDDADLAAARLARERDDNTVLLFRSTTAVPRRQRAPSRLELRRGDLTLVAHLPQPGMDRTTARFIVHVSKP